MGPDNIFRKIGYYLDKQKRVYIYIHIYKEYIYIYNQLHHIDYQLSM